MSTTTPEPIINVRGMAEWAAFIPHQLGFVPSDGSLVLCLERDGIISGTMRCDRGAAALEAAVLASAIHREAPGSNGFLIGWQEPVAANVEGFAHLLSRFDVRVEGVYRTEGEELIDLRTNTRETIPQDAECIVRKVSEGSAPAASRAEAVEWLAPRPLPDGLQAAYDAQGKTAAGKVAAVWRKILRDGPQSADVGTLAVALRGLDDLGCRDGVLVAVAPEIGEDAGFVAPDGWDLSEVDRATAREHLAEVSRIAPTGAVAAACSIAAAAYWASSDSIAAETLAGRALGEDEAHPLAQLVMKCVALGVNPRNRLQK